MYWTFLCDTITILTSFPLHNVLHKSEVSRRPSKLAVELNEYDVSIQPLMNIKSHALVDFTPTKLDQAEKTCLQEKDSWNLQVDGSILTSLEGNTIQLIICREFKATNNECEYKSLITGLNLDHDMGITDKKCCYNLCFSDQFSWNRGFVYCNFYFLCMPTLVLSHRECFYNLCFYEPLKFRHKSKSVNHSK